jgi:UDP-glucose 4-epimerase
MRILITGAAGFIGSNLIKRLLAQGNEVVGIDNLFLGKIKFIESHINNKNFKFINLDILNSKELIILFNQFCPEIVWHLAANSDISYGEKYTDFDLKGGTLVTYNILEAMRISGCKRILFSSSGAVYGEPNIHPTSENYGPLMPISLYAASKLASEGLVSSYAHTFGIQAWIFRFGNIIGPNPTHGVIYDFANNLLKDENNLKILGDGTQKKPYMHVEDCLDGMEYVYRNTNNLVNIFNLSANEQTTVLSIAIWILEEMNIKENKCNFSFTGGNRGWRGDVPFVDLDNTKITMLGWLPKYSSDSAVKKSIKEIVSQLKEN